MAFNGKCALLVVSAAVALSSTAMAQSQTGGGSDWASKVKLDGWFRYRFERVLDASTTPTTVEDRQRLAFKFGLGAQVNDKLSFYAQLGTQGASALATTNQTLGGTTGYNNFKSIMLMQAALKYKLMDGVTLMAGKYASPIVRTGGNIFFFFPEYNNEGLSVVWNGDMGAIKPFASLSSNRMVNRTNEAPSSPSSTVGPDVDSTEAQVGARWSMDQLAVMAQLQMRNYNNMKGLNTALLSSVAGGNTTTTTGCVTAGTCYKYDYKLTGGGVEVKYNLGFAPVMAYYEMITNSDPSEKNNATYTGVKLGETKEPGSWYVQYNYVDMAADSVVSTMTHMGFMGGGTNTRGHEIVLGYQIAPGFGAAFYYDTGTKSVATTNTMYENYLLDLTATF